MDAHAKLQILLAAALQIRNASKFTRILKAILVLGNKMAGVTKNDKSGLVRAFTSNSLGQLALTKSFDTSTSVLQVRFLSFFLSLYKYIHIYEPLFFFFFCSISLLSLKKLILHCLKWHTNLPKQKKKIKQKI
jgi:hypothetical protein